MHLRLPEAVAPAFAHLVEAVAAVRSVVAWQVERLVRGERWHVRRVAAEVLGPVGEPEPAARVDRPTQRVDRSAETVADDRHPVVGHLHRRDRQRDDRPGAQLDPCSPQPGHEEGGSRLEARERESRAHRSSLGVASQTISPRRRCQRLPVARALQGTVPRSRDAVRRDDDRELLLTPRRGRHAGVDRPFRLPRGTPHPRSRTTRRTRSRRGG